MRTGWPSALIRRRSRLASLLFEGNSIGLGVAVGAGEDAMLDSASSNKSIRPAESGPRIGSGDESRLILGDELPEAPRVLGEANPPRDPHECRLVVGVPLSRLGLAPHPL